MWEVCPLVSLCSKWMDGWMDVWFAGRVNVECTSDDGLPHVDALLIIKHTSWMSGLSLFFLCPISGLVDGWMSGWLLEE